MYYGDSLELRSVVDLLKPAVFFVQPVVGVPVELNSVEFCFDEWIVDLLG